MDNKEYSRTVREVFNTPQGVALLKELVRRHAEPDPIAEAGGTNPMLIGVCLGKARLLKELTSHLQDPEQFTRISINSDFE